MVLVMERGVAVVPVPVAERDAVRVVMDVDAPVAVRKDRAGVEQEHIAPLAAVLVVGVPEADDLTSVFHGVHRDVVEALLHELEVAVSRVELVAADLVIGRAGVHGHGVAVARDGDALLVAQTLQVVEGRPVPLPVSAENDRVDDGRVGFHNGAQTVSAAVGVGQYQDLHNTHVLSLGLFDNYSKLRVDGHGSLRVEVEAGSPSGDEFIIPLGRDHGAVVAAVLQFGHVQGPVVLLANLFESFP